MMETLSPLTRRIVAIGLLLLAVLGAVTQIILPLIQANREALRDLADVREALARAEAIKAGPEPRQIVPFPDRATLKAPSTRAARERLAGQLMARAAASGLQLSIRNMPNNAARPPASISLDISVSGSRDALLKWMSGLERDAPACRFRSWRLTDMGQMMGPSAPPMSPGVSSGPPTSPQVAPAAPITLQPAPDRILRLDATVVALWVGAI